MRIEDIPPIDQNLLSSTRTEAPDSGESFSQLLMDAIREVNLAQLDSTRLQSELMAGRKVDYHDVMIAMSRASLALSLTLQVRNKLLEAYQEIQRLQI